jgi:hypothetical protein
MSRFSRFDFSRIRRYPVSDRPSKVSHEAFGRPLHQDSLTAFLESLPNLLAARQLRELVAAIREARRRGRSIIWAFGGHVVKVGLAPVLLDLMEQGFITALATNGSGVIHDFEIALWGKTSEDVDRELSDGGFGMAEETGRWLNQAVIAGRQDSLGIGEAVGVFLERRQPPYAHLSLLLGAHRRGLPLTAHVAIGTDIIHVHPEASGEALGAASLVDLSIFTAQVEHLHEGGVFLNLGSAVILPEVFLKAVSAVRSSGRPLAGFTTANLDFIQHYRPQQNVVRRPVLESGTGISLTGHHELLVPLLAAALKWTRP